MPLLTRPWWRPRPLPLKLLLLLLGLPAVAGATTRYDGDAQAAEGGRLLYRESHWVEPDGGRVVLYRCPGGAAFARKQVGGGSDPDFELVDARDGYREGVRTRQGRREMFLQRPGRPEQAVALPPANGPRIVDAGFDEYLRAHWDTAAAQRVDFVLPGLQRTLAFRIQDQGEHDGLRRYRLAVAAWYGGALPHVDVAYAMRDRRLAEFDGVGNIRDDAGAYPRVRIVFPAQAQRPAAPGEAEQARRQPLVARCAAA